VAARYTEQPRGEVTLVLGPVEAPAGDEAAADAAVAELREAGLPTRQASRLVAGLTGLPARGLYDRATRK
jgi:16S rRNA C1402 (ribose-2'-O) methylase RsmI